MAPATAGSSQHFRGDQEAGRSRPGGNDQENDPLPEEVTMDDQDRDAELSAALEKFLRDTMASGYTKEQAVEMIRQEICDAEVRHRRSQIKPVP